MIILQVKKQVHTDQLQPIPEVPTAQVSESWEVLEHRLGGRGVPVTLQEARKLVCLRTKEPPSSPARTRLASEGEGPDQRTRSAPRPRLSSGHSADLPPHPRSQDAGSVIHLVINSQ